ncbi:hypothetical protein [Nostoc sp. DedSLP04]|uniref:hypothetical protein n=1 Tax=Nostoc sp. DedSLP04 TaxID=3075401 RepID=UPI002AD38A5E|nr:hypothetical protein [Nostoc sp. DedSLP04]MDZ8030156.1 hypothetical protein [Nostoc sp. DedSLP04]
MQDSELEKKIEYAKIMLEEYKTLRTEIINKQTLINNIVNFSFAIIGVTLGAIATVVTKEPKNGEEFVLIATAVIIPFVCWFAFVQYYLEFIYTARISRYIVAIEYKINTLFGEHLLFWESGIRNWEISQLPEEISQLHKFMHIQDKLVRKLLILPLNFSLIAICSSIFSIIYGSDCCKDNNIPYLKIIVYIVMLILFFSGIYFWFQFQKVLNRMQWSHR